MIGSFIISVDLPPDNYPPFLPHPKIWENFLLGFSEQIQNRPDIPHHLNPKFGPKWGISGGKKTDYCILIYIF